MALSVTIADRSVTGSKRRVTGTLNMGSYATSGVAYTPEQFGLFNVERLRVEPKLGTGSVLNLFRPNYSGRLILGYLGSTGAEISNSTDLSTTPGALDFEAVGY